MYYKFNEIYRFFLYLFSEFSRTFYCFEVNDNLSFVQLMVAGSFHMESTRGILGIYSVGVAVTGISTCLGFRDQKKMKKIRGGVLVAITRIKKRFSI